MHPISCSDPTDLYNFDIKNVNQDVDDAHCIKKLAVYIHLLGVNKIWGHLFCRYEDLKSNHVTNHKFTRKLLQGNEGM